MAKRKFRVTEAERKELLQAYQVCKNTATRTRYQAVRLYGEGYPEAEIEQITHRAWSINELVVRERYGVAYQSRTSYSSLLHLCGFSYQKTEKIFKSRSQIKVADFEEQLEKN